MRNNSSTSNYGGAVNRLSPPPPSYTSSSNRQILTGLDSKQPPLHPSRRKMDLPPPPPQVHTKRISYASTSDMVHRISTETNAGSTERTSRSSSVSSSSSSSSSSTSSSSGDILEVEGSRTDICVEMEPYTKRARGSQAERGISVGEIIAKAKEVERRYFTSLAPFLQETHYASVYM